MPAFILVKDAYGNNIRLNVNDIVWFDGHKSSGGTVITTREIYTDNAYDQIHDVRVIGTLGHVQIIHPEPVGDFEERLRSLGVALG